MINMRVRFNDGTRPPGKRLPKPIKVVTGQFIAKATRNQRLGNQPRTLPAGCAVSSALSPPSSSPPKLSA